MDYLLQLIRATLGTGGTAELAFAILIGGVAMLVIVAGGLIYVTATDPLRRRVRNLNVTPQPIGNSERGLKGLLTFWKNPKSITGLQSHLLHAGYDADTGAANYRAIRVLLIVGLPALVFIAASYIPSIPPNRVLLLALAAAVLGYMIPGAILDYQEAKRQWDLQSGFPDALDLLVACTEAGMGMNAALQRVGDQLAFSHPVLAKEFSLVNYEIRGGVDRMTALKNLAERTGLPSIRSFVGVLGQTIRYGTSVAETLRIYAEDLRDKRMQAAEEAAAKIGTKMIFPLVTCLFPSFFLVAIGPGILGVLRAFG